MWNPFKQNSNLKSIDGLVDINLYQFLGSDLPLINDDGFDYINRIWRRIGVVYECTDLLQSKVAKCPLVYYRIKNATKLKQYKSLSDKSTAKALILKARALEEVEPHEALQALLSKPNAQQNYKNFIATYVLSYLITGNTYAYKEMSVTTKRPIEMWAFPELTIISGGTFNPVAKYEQFPSTDYARAYPAENVYHDKTPNLSFNQMGNQLYGVSPLRAYLEPLRTIEEANKQSSKQMFNGGVLGMLFPSAKEDGLNAEQRTAVIEKLKEGLRSNKDFSRFMTSSIPMDFKQLGLPSGDLMLLDIKDANEKALYRLYNVPLQFHSQEASTRDNQKTADRQLALNGVAPLCDMVGDMLTNHIGVHFDNTIIELDYTQLEEMAGNMKEVADMLIPLVEKGIVSRDEARFALKYGETGLDYMNEFWYNDKPLSKIWSGEIKPNNNDNNNNSNQQL